MNKQKLIEKIYSKVLGFIANNNQEDAKLLIKDGIDEWFDEEAKVIRPMSNTEVINVFVSAKRIEGCSEKTITYYKNTLVVLLDKINKNYFLITTEDIRNFLSDYVDKSKVSKTTLDNVRRIISSFFSWLENENYVDKNPCKRIHKIKTVKVVKEIYSDETIELMKEVTSNPRDLAIIDFLLSTGIRVGELVRLNIRDIDFENMECIVLGKGNKQRKVYFDAKSKIHIREYLSKRTDNNEALFVSLLQPFNRLEISGVEIMLRKIGKKLGINKVHPHKFRRTIATKAIDKGMPIEQVQHMLGHNKIDTTLEYAMVDDINVKLSHKKYLE